MKRQARELALQILFQTEFTTAVPYQDFLELFEERTSKDVVDYADELIRGVKARVKEIDAVLQSASQHWKVERMSLVDRNVLRVAVFEMKYSTDPVKPSIAINEAVDIAKRFGSTESGSFVNGLLDQARKQNAWE
ncbi:MAG: transcription antitermination factor NusB [Bdellovibrionaceae bacterium]|nr:transcription antitermination factor NusB [Pseudobdellovibrionaceae bacterium]